MGRVGQGQVKRERGEREGRWDAQTLLSAEQAAMFCPVGSNRQLNISALV